MHIRELDGKAVCLLGYGRDGAAMHEALTQWAPTARITVADHADVVIAEGLATEHVQTGSGHLSGLERFDVLVRSPGVKDSPELDAVGGRTTSSTQIFFDSILDNGVRTIGVTGSKGKSTTTNLIAAALRSTYSDVHLVGNIGVPMIGHLADAKPGTYFVMELSSYQLERLTVSPQIAVLTSLFPEHLDRHGSFAAYQAAKTRIAQFQRPEDVVFYNGSSEQCRKMAATSAGEQVAFYPHEFPLPVEQTRLHGEHNRGNLAGALKVALRCGVDHDVAVAALAAAEGLPYRLHSLGVVHDIEWIDDSLATAPEATIAALEAMGNRVDAILLGGQDRGYDFTELGRLLARLPVRNLVLFPDTGARIRDAVEASGPAEAKRYFETQSMAEAVAFVRSSARPGSVCLLSSASPSYSIFKNHTDKSRQYAEAIYAD